MFSLTTTHHIVGVSQHPVLLFLETDHREQEMLANLRWNGETRQGTATVFLLTATFTDYSCRPGRRSAKENTRAYMSLPCCVVF